MHHKIITNRNSLRCLWKFVLNHYPELFRDRTGRQLDRYYTLIQEDIVLDLEKIGHILILQNSERYEAQPGGFGKGFEDALLLPTAPEESNDKYYKMTSYHLGIRLPTLIKYEVDAEMLSPDGTRYLATELKSIKSNPRYPPSRDFYLNLFGQMFFGGQTPFAKIGYRTRSADGDAQKNTIAKLETKTLQQIQSLAGLTDNKVKQIMTSLIELLEWVFRSTAKHNCVLIIDASN
jgi:hypothetical protein